MNTPDPKVIVALDFSSAKEAMLLVEQLDPSLCKLKVGKELFTREGPAFVKSLVNKQFKVFLDLKFHDIPNTTAKAVGAAADLGVWMVNVHASGGTAMMEAASRELQVAGSETLLIAVTVLTSMNDEQLREVGCGTSLQEQVLRLAKLAYASGLHGVVCSAQEAHSIATQTDQGFLRVTPGIRPLAAAANDQHRIMTPTKAIDNGSSYLVIGRPITQADKPQEALLAIAKEIGDY